MATTTDPNLVPPDPVLAVGERLTENGGELFIVGGWVRDRLMSKDSHDIDLATNLPPDKVKKSIGDLGSVYSIGEKFGTVGITIGDYTLEITTYRREKYEPGSRHPEVEPVEGIAEDLGRRDFTINSIALCVVPEPGLLFDPFDGSEDIRLKTIRAPGTPDERMAEDPLRMMRAARFAAQLGFEIETGLFEVLKKKAALLDAISQERRRDELELVLVSPNPSVGLRTLVDTGLMNHVLPEVAAMKGVEQPPAYHRADVFEHTLLTLEYLEPDPLLRRAALFHDVGKPPAKVTEPKTMFPEHEKIGEELTRAAMKRLRNSNEDIQKTAFLVRHHMRPIRYTSDWSDSAVRRMIKDCTLVKDDEVVVPLDYTITLARADIKAGNLEKAGPFLELVEELEGRIEDARKQYDIETVKSPLNGKELMELFEREQGPWLKSVKAHLVDLVVSGELAPGDKAEAARRARIFIGD